MKKHLIVDPLIRPKYSELILDPVVIRVTKFNEEGAEEFAEKIEEAHTTGQPVIPVVIDSYGGQVYSLCDMVSQIQNCKLPVVTICEGKAMSCGAVLFTMGSERWISKTATLMIHDVSCMEWGKIEEVKAGADEANRLNQYIYKLMAKNCGQVDDYFLKLIHDKSHAEWYIPSQTAKKHNLATNIGVPCLTTEIKVDFTFP